jgi:hypothetical protein
VASRPLGGTLGGRDLDGTQSVGGQHTCALRGNTGVKPGKVCDVQEIRGIKAPLGGDCRSSAGSGAAGPKVSAVLLCWDDDGRARGRVCQKADGASFAQSFWTVTRGGDCLAVRGRGQLATCKGSHGVALEHASAAFQPPPSTTTADGVESG